MDNALQRRGLLGGAATLALLAAHPMATEGKKGNKKKSKKSGIRVTGSLPSAFRDEVLGEEQ